ncbi:MAG: SURF1 family protein [Proteobacteria bacterium]|nr:SURF1 family protein [Pseudomonadota bacterium]MDA1332021.1 SURF1 family protein [Pseudomonadota bacterium]
MRHPSWVITIIALLIIGLTLFAAYWQFQRADYKRTLESRFIAIQAEEVLNLNKARDLSSDFEFRRVTAQGVFDSSRRMILDNRIRRGQAGYEVLVPLLLTGSSDVVLINLGWIPRGREFGQVPSIDMPEGVVLVSGTAVKPGLGSLELSNNTVAGDIWQNLDLKRYRSLYSLDVLDYVIQGDAVDGVTNIFERTWSNPSFGIVKHLSYAGQWILFSILTLFLYIYYGFIKQHEA